MTYCADAATAASDDIAKRSARNLEAIPRRAAAETNPYRYGAPQSVVPLSGTTVTLTLDPLTVTCR
jgi:hypothetical protein